jgi:DNA polymerase-2
MAFAKWDMSRKEHYLSACSQLQLGSGARSPVLFPSPLSGCDPGRGEPSALRLQCGRRKETIPLTPARWLLKKLNLVLDQVDPDFLLTQWGDTWLIPTLLELAKRENMHLSLNRDEQREVAWQKEMSYFSYGQIIYRPEEAHLFGRCHIDQRSAMMWRDYGFDGVLESARVTTLPIENAARVSPGSGISAMQMLTALEQNILVPCLSCS